MNFEQALQASGTVVIKEGIDVDSLGQDLTPSLMFLSSTSTLSPSSSITSSRPHSMIQSTATSLMAPPTPTQPKSPVTSPTSRPHASASTSASSSSNDLFYDVEDPDYQTRRRSMYRSQGTASSPDLATLVRKAKQRGSILPPQLTGKDRRHETAPPLPLGSHAPLDPSLRPRHRSSTSSSGHSVSPVIASSAMSKGKLQKARQSTSPSNGSEWVLTGTSHDDVTIKAVRQKTSALWGRMLGQNTMRERSKTDASSPSRRTMQTPPPVPSLSADRASPVASQLPEPSPASSQPTPLRTTSDLSKPLPSLEGEADGKGKSTVVSEPSLVAAEREPTIGPSLRPQSPEKTVRACDTTTPVRVFGHGKRRSMSVGEVDLKKATNNVSTALPLPIGMYEKRSEDSVGWDSTIRGILSDFKGELSQLDQDPIAKNTLALRVPSAPPERPLRPRMRSAEATTSAMMQSDTRHPTSSPLPTLRPNPTIVAHAPDADGESNHRESTEMPEASMSPRSPSLFSGTSMRAFSYSQRPFPSAGARPLGPRSASSTHASSDARDRLLAHPRRTAFNSEPSLVPANGNAVSSPLSAISQQDLTTSPSQQLRRLPSDSLGSTDPDKIEVRGKECARRAWEEDESFLVKERIAEWLGGVGQVNKIALRHYIDNFDFSGLRLDLAFRRLCAKLFLKAETQQVDRILEEFSRRYWDCNPGSLFGNSGVVHAVAYSLLLLNTDLHVADLATRMSRGQFVRNTLFTIQMQLQPNLSVQGSSSDLMQSDRDADSLRGPGSEGSDIGTNTVRSQPKRSDSITSWNSITRDAALANLFVGSSATVSTTPLPNDSTASVPASTTSVSEAKTPSTLVSSVVYDRSWESDVESLLKEMYNAIKSQQVLQPLGSRTSTSSLTPNAPLRNRSLRTQQDRLTTFKRGSIRGIQSILGAPNGMSPYSSNSSVDGRASPAPSFATSANENIHGSTMSFLAPALGFASNLSHTIIREAQEDDDRSERSDDSADTTISITDEELALLGPPWAKEGMLCRKQYNESAGKRAKSKAWMDVFVVIQKGELNMFTFGEHAIGGQRVVGGGNWLENANHVGMLQLAHSLAHSLPPPGYNRQRPFCMVLTLSSGAVYFFQAGTEELVNEWVQTCNYWAARQSKEPLAGGVSNMEYGWNRVSDVLQHGRSLSDDESARMHDYTDTMSVRSGRSSHSRFSRKDGASTMRVGSSPWSDRTNINEWKLPLAPSVPSTHDEETQLETLKKHVATLMQELQEHNELRGPMMALYPSRSQNAAKALSNWEKKSQYLLAEHVKYESYVDSLQAAMTLRFKRRGEKALEHALRSGVARGSSKGKRRGRPYAKTIIESEEPPPVVIEPPLAPNARHRREFAFAQVDADEESDA
ncbi:hypothetical protein B0F90DRAFT_1815266 [Multifurca ochricompacta]|uniref:SEC7 domain-containing protein n=1 Tax=Multifurca ochricompacta TaxID=376703 RepID=A0AAD4QNB6_9AGAM|nr:hypothetical protein B0F90DRAFT_1815266 [Multifurca ochricompacta]